MSPVRALRWFAFAAVAASALLAGCAASVRAPELIYQNKSGELGELKQVDLVFDVTSLVQYHGRGTVESYYNAVGEEAVRRLAARGVQGHASVVAAAGTPPDTRQASHVVLLQPQAAKVTRTIGGVTGGHTTVSQVQWDMRTYARGAGGKTTLVHEARFRYDQGLAPIPLETVWRNWASEMGAFIDQQLRGAGI